MAGETVEVQDDRGNVVVIRKKMGFGVRNRVLSAAAKGMTPGKSPEMDIGAYNTALLLNNIVAWRGPDLDGVPISEAGLDDLDMALGDLVLAKITELNQSAVQTDPKEPTSGGEAP